MNQADLRSHLHGNRTGKIQVGKLLLKAIASCRKLLHGLGVLGGAARLRLGVKLSQITLAHRGQTLTASQQVHGEFLEVGKVKLVELIKGGRILHKSDLMLLKRLGNLIDVGLGGVIAVLQRRQLVRLTLEQGEEALLLVIGIEAAQLGDHAGNEIARLAQVLRAHLRKRRLRERRHFLLRARSEGQHLLRVCDVNLLCESVHLRQLLGREGVCQRGQHGRGRLDNGRLNRNAVFDGRLQGENGGRDGGEALNLVGHGGHSRSFLVF